jgi:hypothetical protein
MSSRIKKIILRSVRRRAFWYAGVYARVFERLDQVEDGAK